jgi:sodium-independent sulfate anion transporter 11
MDKKEKLNSAGRFIWFLGAAGNFFTVALGTVIAYAWNEIAHDEICSKGHNHTINKNCLTLTGHIDAGLPDAIAPSISGGDFSSLLSGAILVALIGYLESIAIAKAFARSNGYEVASSQELVAIGASNIVSGFFQSYPVTGSFSRTAVNSASSVATPLSGVVTGTVVMCALAFMTKIMAFIPKASLGAIVIVSVLKMFNYEIVLKMWKVNKVELIPWAISFFGCTFTDIEYGVGFGAFANIVIVLYYTARPAFIVDASSKTRVIKIGGSVLYPAGSSWKDFVREQLDDSAVKSIVLDFAMVHRLDYTGLQALTEITEDCRKERVIFDVANVGLMVQKMLETAEYFEKNNIDRASCSQSTAAAVASVEQSLVVNPAGSRTGSVDDTTPLLSVNN